MNQERIRGISHTMNDDHGDTLQKAFLAALQRTGSEYDRASNVVGVGADNGKILDSQSPYASLVTKDVASCIAVIALDEQGGRAGVWHLHHNEWGDQIENELIPGIRQHFDPDKTGIYLIGGKEDLSEKLATRLTQALPAAGYKISNTALLGEARLDVAVTRDGAIYVAAQNADHCLFYKPPEKKADRAVKPAAL